MKADKDITGFEYTIYYFNRFSIIVLSIIAIALSWEFMLPALIVGWVIYFVMYYMREVFYKQGIGRFNLYATLFYIGLIIASWAKITPLDFTLSFDFSLKRLTYLFKYLTNPDHWTTALWGICVGVVIYIIMVEFDRPKIKKQDRLALGISEKNLYCYPYYAGVLSHFVAAFVLLCVWNITLSIFIVLYGIASFYIRRSFLKWLDLALLIIFIVVSYKTNLNMLLSWTAEMQRGLKVYKLALFKGEVLSFLLYLKIGVLWGLVPLFIARVVTGFSMTKKAMIIINEVDQEKYGHQVKGDMLIGKHYATRHNVELTDKENNQHTLIMGTTGAGKTTAILNYVEHSAKNGYPCIFLDGKGSADLPLKMKQIADKYNRKFKYFTLKPHVISGELQGHLASYNPFGSGTFTEWKNRIMALFAQSEGRGQQHYALMEEKFVNTIVNILQKAGGTLNLATLLTFIRDPELLQHLAAKVGDKDLIKQAEFLNEQREIATDVVALLELFVHSSYGMLFDTKQYPNVIDLKQSIKNGEIVLFMFDSSAYKSDTEKVAKMVINDLNSSFSELTQSISTYAIFDEFASYASSNLSDTISLHRSNGMHAVVGTQSVTTVGLKSMETQRIAEELLACCNTYLLMATNHDEDIERMAKIFGTRRTFEVTTQLDVKQGGGTGLGSSKTVDEFLVHPQKIRDLKPGEAFIYRKASGLKPFKMRVNQVTL